MSRWLNLGVLKQCFFRGSFATVSLLMSVFSPTVLADATLNLQRMVHDHVTHELKMWVKDDHIRLGPLEEVSGYLIFDHQAKSITQVDDVKKEYRVVDEQTVRQLRSTLDALQEKVLAELPADQRDKMQEIIGDVTGKVTMPTTLPKHDGTILRNTGQKRKVREYECEIVEQSTPKEKLRDICVIKPEVLGLLKQDIQTAKSFYEYVRQVAAQLPGGEALVDQLAVWNPLLDRVPLQVKRFDAGKLESIYEMTSVDTSALSAALFSVPKGYRRVTLTSAAP